LHAKYFLGDEKESGKWRNEVVGGELHRFPMLD